jgi:hypothetical protein
MAKCQVCIWKLRGKKAYHVVGLAHAGLRLETRAKADYYITLWNRSWAPKNGMIQGLFPSQKTEANKIMGFTEIKKGDKIVPNDQALGSRLEVNYDKDKRTHGRPKDQYEPDDWYNVPIAYDGDNLFGVSDIRIEKFWTKVLEAEPGDALRRYALFSKHNNCCGIVADALCEGGLDFYAPPPGNLIYQDARTLFKWVEKASARIKGMNLVYATVRDRNEIRWERDDRIPSYADWKKESEKGVGFFASRRMQISFIDDYIKAYHLAVRKNDKEAQYHYLIQIQFQAFDYLANKPTDHLTNMPITPRGPAVLRLVARVHNAMTRLQREYEAAPSGTNLGLPPDTRQRISSIIVRK